MKRYHVSRVLHDGSPYREYVLASSFTVGEHGVLVFHQGNRSVVAFSNWISVKEED